MNTPSFWFVLLAIVGALIGIVIPIAFLELLGWHKDLKHWFKKKSRRERKLERKLKKFKNLRSSVKDAEFSDEANRLTVVDELNDNIKELKTAVEEEHDNEEYRKILKINNMLMQKLQRYRRCCE